MEREYLKEIQLILWQEKLKFGNGLLLEFPQLKV